MATQIGTNKDKLYSNNEIPVRILSHNFSSTIPIFFKTNKLQYKYQTSKEGQNKIYTTDSEKI